MTSHWSFGPISYTASGELAIVRLFGYVIWRKCGAVWAVGPLIFGRGRG